MSVQDPIAVLEPKSATRPVRRDAVGAEIPVTVHASRTTQGLGNNLPSVHEETKTVIVLPQGAVVRLTAGLTTGETIVLTNRMTGSDILCRVGNVKSQPGIQHYVDLEFIQRAPNFWGDAIAAASVPVVSQAPAPAPRPPAPSAATVNPVTVLPPPSARVPVAAPPPAPVAIAAPPPAPIAVAAPPAAVAPPVSIPAPVVQMPPAAMAEPLQPAPLAEPIAVSWKAPKGSSIAPDHGSSDNSSFGSLTAHDSGHRSSTSHRTLLPVAAAALLALGAGAGGYWFFSKPAAASSVQALQQPAVIPPVNTPPDPTSGSFETITSAPLSAAVSAPSPAPRTDIFLESRPAAEPAADRVQPPSASIERPPATAVARRPAARPNLRIGQLQAPKMKSATARAVSGDAPPVIAGNLSLGETGAVNSLLIAEAVAPAPPPGSSRPAVGGQLQLPQMLTSTPPVYPRLARMQRVEGVVVLDALVDETGNVVETKVVAGPQPLLAAARESVQQWKYRPAQLNGKPIAVHTRVSVKFSLQ